jgi:hypothetical protein
MMGVNFEANAATSLFVLHVAYKVKLSLLAKGLFSTSVCVVLHFEHTRNQMKFSLQPDAVGLAEKA